MFKTSKRLEGIGEYYFSQKLREIDELNRQGKNIINLGIGSPDQPPHPDVIKTLQEESAKPTAHAYQSYKGSPVLRKAMSGWYKKWYRVDLDPDTEILPLIGSKEGIMLICMTYFEEGTRVLVPNPGYPTYSAAVKLSGATPVYYELKEENNYQPDFAQLENIIGKEVTSVCKGLILNYPHMPTGQKASRPLFEKLVAFAKKHDLILLHDNPYSFILNDDPISLLGIQGAGENVLELNSLSKSHNMAGWRVGMLCAAKEKIDEVLRFKSNMDSGMFLPVQLAAARALTLAGEWYEGVNRVYRARREKVYQLLDTLKCHYAKSQSGLFMWAKIPAKYTDGYALCDEILYQYNVFITPGGIFGSAGNNYVRISLCASEEKITEAISRIKN
jgi:LL-diaminopimelate aminotransferase